LIGNGFEIVVLEISGPIESLRQAKFKKPLKTVNFEPEFFVNSRLWSVLLGLAELLFPFFVITVFSWRPNIEIKGPIPLVFSNEIVDYLVNFFDSNSENQTMEKLIYVGQ